MRRPSGENSTSYKLRAVAPQDQKAAKEAYERVQALIKALKQQAEAEAAHRSKKRKSTEHDHEMGTARKARDRGGEKGDARRRPPRKRPKNWKDGTFSGILISRGLTSAAVAVGNLLRSHTLKHECTECIGGASLIAVSLANSKRAGERSRR